MHPRPLIDELLEEQASLTAVERFAQRHSAHQLPLNQPFYRDLIPLSRPAPGHQYAFQVDLDRCTGCKACVAACHSLNGLDEEESWRKVGLLKEVEQRSGISVTVTTACHHCTEPGCLEGCPTQAYEKDPQTGIVHHLDDQCIGCQYCVLKCPYDVPHYSKSRGIVRKCDMCANRLAVGEAPACVQSCPNQAIQIVTVEQTAIAKKYLAEPASFLPDSPDPRHTLPTTKFISNRSITSLVSGNEHRITPARGHFPLAAMLILTQAATGFFLLAVMQPSESKIPALMGLVTFLAGMIVSLLHLGRPLHAWKAFLGFRTSWLSREIVAFGVVAKLAILWVATLWNFIPFLTPYKTLLGVTTTLTALAAVGCSIMVYADTHREFWALRYTAPRFISTTLLFSAVAFQLLQTGNPFVAGFAVLLRSLRVLQEVRLPQSPSLIL
ncbi:MAG: DmsC/YnfH family molybdoenzyme membrane anchor subunit, partial [Verrucomicrobiota bacterium]|nr:DmsC/YnfH family molybdoenzyme membrane anchor subunit [Verrucomicrobiota bacterium]